jgi:hypothetical protein
VKFHPLANLFPRISKDELSRLADDIKQRGLDQPIVTYRARILDGRNRAARRDLSPDSKNTPAPTRSVSYFPPTNKQLWAERGGASLQEMTERLAACALPANPKTVLLDPRSLGLGRFHMRIGFEEIS